MFYSAFLTVYKAQITSVLSIFQRISGIILFLVILCNVFLHICLMTEVSNIFVLFFISIIHNSVFYLLLYYVCVFSVCYHITIGFWRFFCWHFVREIAVEEKWKQEEDLYLFSGYSLLGFYFAFGFFLFFVFWFPF